MKNQKTLKHIIYSPTFLSYFKKFSVNKIMSLSKQQTFL